MAFLQVIRQKEARTNTRALRVIYKPHSDKFEELLRPADILSLYNKRLQDITALMYKVKHGLVPDCVSDIFLRKGSTRCGIVTSHYHVFSVTTRY